MALVDEPQRRDAAAETRADDDEVVHAVANDSEFAANVDVDGRGAAALVLFIGMPPALGSWWGLVLTAPLIGTLVARILDEEQALSAELAGYDAYRERVRYRLVPGVW